MDVIVGLHKMLQGHELLFGMLVGYICIWPPFGLVSPLVISRSRRGFVKTLPLVGSAIGGDALICLLLACALTPVMQFFHTYGYVVKVMLLAVASVVLIFLLVRKFTRKKPLLSTKGELLLGFIAAVTNPVNYAAFGSAQLMALPDVQASQWGSVLMFYSAVLVGCAAAWLTTASYIPLYRLGRKSFKAIRRKPEEATATS